MGARLEADTVWTQAAGVVQVLGEPVQVPVQPVEEALVRLWREAGVAGRQGMGLGSGWGGTPPTELLPSPPLSSCTHLLSDFQQVTPSSLGFIFPHR